MSHSNTALIEQLRQTGVRCIPPQRLAEEGLYAHMGRVAQWYGDFIGEKKNQPTGRPNSLPGILQRVYKETQSLFHEMPGYDSLDCKRGCNHCCHWTVSVSDAEAALIRKTLKKHPQKKRLEQRLKQTAEKIKGMDPAQRGQAKIPCAFLDDKDGACSIYEVRPLSCRAYTSSSLAACQAALVTSVGGHAGIASYATGEILAESLAMLHREAALPGTLRELHQAVLAG